MGRWLWRHGTMLHRSRMPYLFKWIAETFLYKQLNKEPFLSDSFLFELGIRIWIHESAIYDLDLLIDNYFTNVFRFEAISFDFVKLNVF